MGGGGSSSSYRPPVQAAAPTLKPVPTADIQANMASAFGPTATPNPYVAGNQAPWMAGWFGMPSWGMDPFGNPLTQEQMTYQRPQAFDDQMAAQNAPPQVQVPQSADPFGSRISDAQYAIGSQMANNLGYQGAISHGYTPRYEDQFNVQARYLDTCAREGGKMVNGMCQYG